MRKWHGNNAECKAWLKTVPTGVELTRFALADWVSSVAFDPTGRRLAAGDYDGTTHVWTLGRSP